MIPSEAYFLFNGFSIHNLSEIGHIDGDIILDLRLRLKGGMVDGDQINHILRPFTMPTFFLDDENTPTVWLTLVNIALEESGRLSSIKKFNSCVTALPAEILTKIGRLVGKISTHVDPFEELKKSILDLYREPLGQIFSRFFKEQAIGSELPSIFLKRSIEGLERLQEGITKDDKILRHFFIRITSSNTGYLSSIRINFSREVSSNGRQDCGHQSKHSFK